MKVENALYPDKEQMAELQQAEDREAICMVNLFKFKDKAAYDDSRETDLSGREAFYLYVKGVHALLDKVGASITFEAGVRRLMMGHVDDLWDEVFIATYPSRKAMLEMMMMPEMAELSVHRAAGLEGQLNIETVLIKDH